MNVQSFSPVENKVIAATTTSATTTFSATKGAPVGQLEVNNESASTAFIAWGTGSATATNDGSSYAVLAGQSKLINIGYADTVAVRLSTGTGNVYLSAGNGM